MLDNTLRFRLRRNKDGSCDSICLSCFRTVATVAMEADLAPFEQSHICGTESQPSAHYLQAGRYTFYTKNEDLLDGDNRIRPVKEPRLKFRTAS